uniref:Uncharacterized protein n=1 Tax=Ciona savignyi TaxID=51511 RepID=H2ZAB3_CIOSA
MLTVFFYSELSSGNSTSPVWSCSSSSSSVNSSEASWVFDFPVPWSKCSSAMLELLGKGEPPNPMQRRQLVHDTIDGVLKITSKPGRKNIERIAFSIVAKYPDSFRDAIDGVSIGNGHGSLTNELFNRWENTMRKKRKLDSSDTSSPSE